MAGPKALNHRPYDTFHLPGSLAALDCAISIIDDEPEPERIHTEFEEAIHTLVKLATKPAANFAGVVADNDLMMVIDFLNHVPHKLH